MWKQEDKYKECCHNDGCESFDTCIECWDEFAERNPPMTNADRIRAMSDEDLAWELMTWRVEALAKSKGDESHYPNTKATILEWLRQPAEVE